MPRVASNTTYMAIVVSGIFFMIPPLALVKSLSQLDNLEPCQDRDCFFPANPWTLEISPSFSGSLNSTHLNFSLEWLKRHHRNLRYGSPVCKGADAAHMKQWCAGVTPRDKNGKDILEGQWFFVFPTIIWGVMRVVHDLMVLTEQPDGQVFIVSCLSLMFLGCSTFFGTNLTTAAFNLFYHDLGDGCGCYFAVNSMQALATVAVPITLIMHLRAKTSDLYCELMNGPHIVTQKHHVPYRMFTANALNPTGTLLMVRHVRGYPGTDASSVERSVPSLNLIRWLQFSVLIAHGLLSYSLLIAGLVLTVGSLGVLCEALSGPPSPLFNSIATFIGKAVEVAIYFAVPCSVAPVAILSFERQLKVRIFSARLLNIMHFLCKIGWVICPRGAFAIALEGWRRNEAQIADVLLENQPWYPDARTILKSWYPGSAPESSQSLL